MSYKYRCRTTLYNEQDLHMVVRDYKQDGGRKNKKKISVRFEPRIIPISSRLF